MKLNAACRVTASPRVRKTAWLLAETTKLLVLSALCVCRVHICDYHDSCLCSSCIFGWWTLSIYYCGMGWGRGWKLGMRICVICSQRNAWMWFRAQRDQERRKYVRKLWSYLIGFVAPKYAITLLTTQYRNGEPCVCVCMTLCVSRFLTPTINQHKHPVKVMTWLESNNHTKALKFRTKAAQLKELLNISKSHSATITAESPQQQYSTHITTHTLANFSSTSPSYHSLVLANNWLLQQAKGQSSHLKSIYTNSIRECCQKSSFP